MCLFMLTVASGKKSDEAAMMPTAERWEYPAIHLISVLLAIDRLADGEKGVAGQGSESHQSSFMAII